MNETGRLGGKISLAAAQALASSVGNDTQLAHHELQKLLMYVNHQRCIEVHDVDLLTPVLISDEIFTMTDAIGALDCRRALDVLHDLFMEYSIEELLAMIVRQFRLLSIVKEALIDGMDTSGICGLVRLPVGVVEKYIKQASGFRQAELMAIYPRLLELDLSNKTSRMPPDVALDAFIVALSIRA